MERLTNTGGGFFLLSTVNETSAPLNQRVLFATDIRGSCLLLPVSRWASLYFVDLTLSSSSLQDTPCY